MPDIRLPRATGCNRGKAAMIREYNGLRFNTIKGDENVWQEIFVGNDYRLPRIKPGMRVLDIGAYKGFVTVLCASQGAFVKCFEPHAVSFQTLIGNIRLNNLQEHVESLKAAVWSENGIAKLIDNPFHSPEEAAANGSAGNDGG